MIKPRRFRSRSIRSLGKRCLVVSAQLAVIFHMSALGVLFSPGQQIARAESATAEASYDELKKIERQPSTTGTLRVSLRACHNIPDLFGTCDDQGDELPAANEWDVHVMQNGSEVPDSPQPGDAGGTLYALEAGTYSVSATIHDPGVGYTPYGYTPTFFGCPEGMVTVTAGGAASCDQAMTKTQVQFWVKKDIDDDGNGTADQFNVGGWYHSLAGNGINLTHQLMNTGHLLSLGTYTATEEQQAGYASESWSCVDVGSGAVIASGTGETLNVTLADVTCDVTCTFINKPVIRPPTGTMTVHKNVDTDGNGTADQTNVTDWTWNIDGTQQNIATGSSVTLNTGTYTISENQKDGYQVTDLTCNGTSYGAVASKSVELTTNNLDCTFTNTKTIAPPAPAIALQKTGPAAVTAAENIAYTLTWAVSGAGVTNAIITDTVPANTSLVSADCGTTAGTCSAVESNGTVSWDLGSRAAGATGTVTLTVQTLSLVANGTVVTNVATFDTTETSPVTATATTTINSASTLSLTKTDSPDPVAPGGTVTYTLTWSVAGTQPVTNLVLTDSLPAEATFVSASNSGAHNGVTPGGTVTWQLGNHVPGDTGTVTLTVTVGSTLSNAVTITNTATLSSAETPSVTATQVTTVTAAPVLTIKKSVNLTFANPGNTLTYTIEVANTGNDKAKNVTVTDNLPQGFTYTDGTGGVKTFIVGDLEVGKTGTLTYTVHVSAEQPAGTYVNTAVAKADNAPQVTATVALEVRTPVVAGITTSVTSPMLSLQKTTKAEFANPGDTIRYTLKITNSGDGDAEDVRIKETLPDHFTFSDTGSSKRTWTIGTLLPGETRTIQYDVTITKDAPAGTYTNIAVASAQDQPNIEARVSIEVRVPKALGATLPETGADSQSLWFFLVGLSYMLVGVWGIRKVRYALPT